MSGARPQSGVESISGTITLADGRTGAFVVALEGGRPYFTVRGEAASQPLTAQVMTRVRIAVADYLAPEPEDEDGPDE